MWNMHFYKLLLRQKSVKQESRKTIEDLANNKMKPK